MASYEDVENKMKSYILDKDNGKEMRENVLLWFNDFNPIFYEQMVECVKTCNNDNVDGVENVKKLGNDLNGFGGKNMMISNFYIMSNFMDCKSIHLCNLMWNNIGEWKY